MMTFGKNATVFFDAAIAIKVRIGFFALLLAPV